MKRPTNETISSVISEVVRARTKHPGSGHLLAALMEEVGELAQAMLHVEYEGGQQERILEEAIQVACVAIRIMEEGDPTIVPSYPVLDYVSTGDDEDFIRAWDKAAE